jgi:hypothetical protein
MHETTSFRGLARLAFIVLLVLVMVVMKEHYCHPATLFASPIVLPEPTPHRWIAPSGGRFTDLGCPGIEIIFPEGFLDLRVNAHCNRTTLTMQPGPGLEDVGLRFFFGVWSGSGEVTHFQRPVHIRIPYEGQWDGRKTIAREMEARLCLGLWDEEMRAWRCLPSIVDEWTNVVDASVDSLLPTRYIQGWKGNSLMALFIQGPVSSPVPTATPTRAPTEVLTPTQMPTQTRSPTPAPALPTVVPRPSTSQVPSSTRLTSVASPLPSSTEMIKMPTPTLVTPSLPSAIVPPYLTPSPTPIKSPEPVLPNIRWLCFGLALGMVLGLVLGLGTLLFRSRKG